MQDKPTESVFGYISVLPGAFSAYRYIALQNDIKGHGPLQEYFKGETLHHSPDADLWTKNMYLAEDRSAQRSCALLWPFRSPRTVLCWELGELLGIVVSEKRAHLLTVSKRGSSWILHYVKSAYATTDVPDQVGSTD